MIRNPFVLRPQVAGLALVTACAAGSLVMPARADDAACIAASEQSLTLRQAGHLHDALKQLAICADPACPAEVKDECTRRIEAVGGAMPTLVLGAKDGAGNDLSAVSVTVDGDPLTSVLDGRPIALDPGTHTFRFEAAGQPPIEREWVLREGEKDRRESVVIGPPAPPPSPAPATVPPTAALPPPAHAEPSPWTTTRIEGAAAAGAGVVGLVLGVVFGSYASAAQNRERSDCGAQECMHRAQASADYDAATKDATGATASFVAGGVLLATGIVLWVVGSPPKTPHKTATGWAPSETRSEGATGWSETASGGTASRIVLVPAPMGAGQGIVLQGEF